MPKQPEPTYSQLAAALQVVLTELESGELDIDAAVGQYAKALEIIAALEKRLQTAENRVSQLTAE